MARDTVGHGVRHRTQWIRGTSVLGQRVVVEIELAGDRVHDDVFQHGPERPRGREDLRLQIGGQVDGLCVATAFEVEDSAVAPAVFVIADQGAVGVCRQGRLSGPREPEEDSDISAHPHVRRTVHRHDIAQGQQIIHDREDRFFDFARVRGAADEHEASAEVDDHEGLRASAVASRVGKKIAGIHYRELGDEAAQVLTSRGDEEVAAEKIVPSQLGDHANRNAVLRIRSRESVQSEDFLVAQIRIDARQERRELLRVKRLVGFSPVDVRLTARLLDEELVLRRASGMFARSHDQRPVRRGPAFFSADALFEQGSGRKVAPDLCGRTETKPLETCRFAGKQRHDGDDLPARSAQRRCGLSRLTNVFSGFLRLGRRLCVSSQR